MFLSKNKQSMGFTMSPFLKQLKSRRLELGLKQHDMQMRVGMSRQQYQRLESRGNPRLDTLELIAKGLKGEIVLIPQERLQAVRAVIDGGRITASAEIPSEDKGNKRLSDDPWRGILGDDE